MTPNIPGYKVGTWTIDATHSEVGFTVRHMMISKVRGHFETFEGKITTAENPLDSSVTAEVDAATINTNQKDRDAHIRTGDFLLVDEHPKITFVSTGVRHDGGDFYVDGDFTMRGVTKPISFKFDDVVFGPDAYGGHRMGGTATAKINRMDFGVKYNSALETGGVLLSEDVNLILELQAVLDQ